MKEGYTPEEDCTTAEDLLLDDHYYNKRHFYDKPGQPKFEKFEMEKRDDWEQTSQALDDFAKPPEEETSFVDLLVAPDAPDALVSLEKQTKIR